MVVMTAKIDKKRVALIFAAVMLAIGALIVLLQGDDTPAAAVNGGDNGARVEFLENFGWQVTTSPVESGQVKIPAEQSRILERYNQLQQSQGYDLSQYAGKTVMRYVYQINNYPGATEPVYATVLVYKDRIIGGDITDTSAKGKIHGFQMPGAQE